MYIGNQAARSHSFADGVPYLFSSGKRLRFILHNPKCKPRHNQILLQSIWSFSDPVCTPSPLSTGVCLLDPVSGISGVSTLILHLLNLLPSSHSILQLEMPSTSSPGKETLLYFIFQVLLRWTLCSDLRALVLVREGKPWHFLSQPRLAFKMFLSFKCKKWQPELNNNFVFLAVSALSL